MSTLISFPLGEVNNYQIWVDEGKLDNHCWIALNACLDVNTPDGYITKTKDIITVELYRYAYINAFEIYLAFKEHPEVNLVLIPDDKEEDDIFILRNFKFSKLSVKSLCLNEPYRDTYAVPIFTGKVSDIIVNNEYDVENLHNTHNFIVNLLKLQE